MSERKCNAARYRTLRGSMRIFALRTLIVVTLGMIVMPVKAQVKNATHLAGDKDGFGTGPGEGGIIPLLSITAGPSDGTFDNWCVGVVSWVHDFGLPDGSEVLSGSLKIHTVDIEDAGEGDGLGGGPYDEKLFVNNVEVPGAFDEIFTPDDPRLFKPSIISDYNIPASAFEGVANGRIAVTVRSAGSSPDCFSIDWAELSITYVEGGTPTAHFVWAVDETNPLKVTFDGTSSSDDGSIQSYQWTFEPGQTGQGAVAQHTFSDEGDFDVSLVVTDDDGKESDPYTETISVDGVRWHFAVELSREPEAAGKSANPANEPVVFGPEDNIYVDVMVTNTGAFPLEDVRIMDDKDGIDFLPDLELEFLPEESRMVIPLLPAGESDKIRAGYGHDKVITQGKFNVVIGGLGADAVSKITGARRHVTELAPSCTISPKMASMDDPVNQGCATGIFRPGDLLVNATGDAPRGTDEQGKPLPGCDTGGTPVTRPDGTEEAECTLRAAVQAVNAGEFSIESGSMPRIAFDIPGSGSRTITISSPLTLTATMVIDGATQPGYAAGKTAASPVIELTGSGSAYGLVAAADGIEIIALSVNRFSSAAILLQGNDSTVRDNHIGTDASGQVAAGDGIGLLIEASNHNRIENNLISGNQSDGIKIQGPGSSFNEIEQNTVGLSKDGFAVLGNATGISISNSNMDRVINNAISGNRDGGLLVEGSSGVRIERNRIGTDEAGNNARPNEEFGVRLYDTGLVTFGGLTPEAGNVVVAETGTVALQVEGKSSNEADEVSIVGINGNRFGRNAAGTSALGVGTVFISKARQVDLTENVLDHIQLVDVSLVDVFDNMLGTLADGQSEARLVEQGAMAGIQVSKNSRAVDMRGNTIAYRPGSGVLLENGAEHNSVIENKIFRNGGSGVELAANAGSGNKLSLNQMSRNQGLGIDLNADGVTKNDWRLLGTSDLDEGSNHSMNHPRLVISWKKEDDLTRVHAELPLNESEGPFDIEFFLSARCDFPTRFGEGEQPFGTVQVPFNPDADWYWFEIPGQLPPGMRFLTATIIAADGSTSEFSRCQEIAEAHWADVVALELSGAISDVRSALANSLRVLARRIDPAGKSNSSNAITVFGSRFNSLPDSSLYSGMAATSNNGMRIQVNNALNRYWTLDHDATPGGGNLEQSEFEFDLCFDASGVVSEVQLEELVVIRRNDASGQLWVPLDTHSEEHDGQYFACVTSVKSLGQFAFGVGANAVVAAPSPEFPADGAEDVARNPTLAWSVVENVPTYDVQIAFSPSFLHLVLESTGVVETSLSVPELAENKTYYWRARGVDASSVPGPWSETFHFSISGVNVASEQSGELPAQVVLDSNYPNPFNPTTTIPFELPTASNVYLAIYDLLGREVAVLVDDRLPGGRHQAVFDAAGVTSGVYLYRLTADGRALTGRMVLLK